MGSKSACHLQVTQNTPRPPNAEHLRTRKVSAEVSHHPNVRAAIIRTGFGVYSTINTVYTYEEPHSSIGHRFSYCNSPFAKSSSCTPGYELHARRFTTAIILGLFAGVVL